MNAGGMLNHVESRMIAWGIWSRRNLDGAIGYPRRTIEGRLRAEGGVLTSGTGSRPAPVDSASEQIDRIVTRLGDHREEWKRMLVLYYCQDATYDYVAHRLGCAESTVRNKWMPAAKHWIAGALEASYYGVL